MKKKAIILIIIIVIILVSILSFSIIKNNKNREKVGDQENEKTEENIDITSYYDYFDNGIMNADIVKESIQIPDDYLEKIIKTNDINTVLERIAEISTIQIPREVIETYENEIKSKLQKDAQDNGKELDEYIKEQYNLEGYEDFIEQNEVSYARIIMIDILHQALALELNVTIDKNDVKKYFSVESDEDLNDIFSNYGEKLAYKYTLENKVETTLLEKM